LLYANYFPKSLFSSIRKEKKAHVDDIDSDLACGIPKNGFSQRFRKEISRKS
jgi:hypothetical protein